jgi:hypothetical protein
VTTSPGTHKTHCQEFILPYIHHTNLFVFAGSGYEGAITVPADGINHIWETI